MRQIGYIDKNVQGNRVYDVDGVGATLASQTGGLGGSGVGLYLIDENDTGGSGQMYKTNEESFEGSPFKYIELFAGIGGFRQALDKLGGECVFASEIDKFAARAYEALYGEHPSGDITAIEAADIPDHDLLVGGFPCQAFSTAGKRMGFEDTRGTLFFEIARIAKEKRPKALLLENVKGLVNHDKGRTLDLMVQTLNDIGYVIDFEILNSKYFGVPQNRERIFIVAVRSDLIEAEEWGDEVTKGSTVVPRGKRRIGGYEWAKTFNFDWPDQVEVTARLRDILEAEVGEKYYLSDERTAKLVAELEEVRTGDVMATLTPDREEKRQHGRRFKNNDEPAFTVNTQDRHGVTEVRPIEYSRKTGVGDTRDVALCLSASDWRGLNRNQKQNAVLETEPVMLGHVDLKGHDANKRVYSKNSVGPTLTAMGGGHREPKTAVESPAEGGKPRYRIRKLTPRECWRLQAFTDEQHDAVAAAGISDSQRYKMAGNAVTVSVIDAIGRRLLETGIFDHKTEKEAVTT